MTETTDAGRTARTGTDESREDKGTANHLIDRTLAGALGGAVLGFIDGLTEPERREQGYHARLDDGRVRVTYVPEVGDERLALSLPVDSANELYKALSDDGESEKYHIEPTASGEVLDIYDDGVPIDIPVVEVLAEERDSLRSALASVLEEQGAAELLDGVKGVLCETNDFEALDADRVKVSYKGRSGFGPNELAALRDSEYWIRGISPNYIVVGKDGGAE